MKVKINIEKRPSLSSFQTIHIDDEIEVDDSLFDNITRSLIKNKKKKCFWYATFDDKLIINYKGKHTYTSEKTLYNGILANFEQLFKYYQVKEFKYDPLINVKFDFKELLDRLLKENRIIFHKLEYDVNEIV